MPSGDARRLGPGVDTWARMQAESQAVLEDMVVNGREQEVFARGRYRGGF